MIRLLSRKRDGAFEFAEFEDGSVPPYAILSHCWSLYQEQDEVTYNDVCSAGGEGSGGGGVEREKKGYKKLELCARWAARDGLLYFWIDTCCIKKADSSELNEAITSMYRWYAEAAKCYAYLEDVTKFISRQEVSGSRIKRTEALDDTDSSFEYWDEDEDEITSGDVPDKAMEEASSSPTIAVSSSINVAEYREPQLLSARATLVEDTGWKLAFHDCKWFTRGWTLQELLAPPSVVFFSADERRLGDRYSLSREISQATSIPVAVLKGHTTPLSFSISERKSWVQNRKTRRLEDTAYCLMGIFDVSIFIMYGEGEKRAHARLDEAIERAYGQQLHDVSRTKRSPWSGWIVFLVAALSIALALMFSVRGATTTAFPLEIDASLPVFAVLGETRIGKSTFIDTLGGRNIKTGKGPEVCDGLESCTHEISFYKADLPFGQVYLVDTPGFDDDKGRDDNIGLETISEQLKQLYDGDTLLKGVIYLYDISAPSIRGKTARVLIKIQQLCGLNGLGNLMLVTTRWTNPLDQAELAKQLEREQNLRYQFWEYAWKHSSSIERYHGTKESASAILGIFNNRERLFDSTGPLRKLTSNTDHQETVNMPEGDASDTASSEFEAPVRQPKYSLDWPDIGFGLFILCCMIC